LIKIEIKSFLYCPNKYFEDIIYHNETS